ncbi:MAG: hypothetical protein KUL82_10810 [Bdellovibrio sp.]|nr:hypothetical protein [Bdellovibrio sp.]
MKRQINPPLKNKTKICKIAFYSEGVGEIFYWISLNLQKRREPLGLPLQGSDSFSGTDNRVEIIVALPEFSIRSLYFSSSLEMICENEHECISFSIKGRVDLCHP